MGLLALAIAPGIAICLFIYFKDKHNREPVWFIDIKLFYGRAEHYTCRNFSDSLNQTR